MDRILLAAVVALTLAANSGHAEDLSEYDCQILKRFKEQSFSEISAQHRLVTDLLSGISLIVSRYVPSEEAREKFRELMNLDDPNYSYLNDVPLPEEQMISEYETIISTHCPNLEEGLE